MSSVVVSGANGFIGSSIIKYISRKNYKVLALVKEFDDVALEMSKYPNVTIHIIDLLDEDIPVKLISDYDYFLHTAWIGPAGKARGNIATQLKNINMISRIIDSVKETTISKFISLGTISQLVSKDIYSVKNIRDNLIYGSVKNLVEDFIYVQFKGSNTRSIWLTLANIYGPGSINGNIVEFTIRELLKGNNPVFSSCNQYYDLLYINDLVKAIESVLESKSEKHKYYVGSGFARPLKEFILEIKDQIDSNLSVVFNSDFDDGVYYDPKWFSVQDLIEDTNYSVKDNFLQNISHTIKSIKER